MESKEEVASSYTSIGAPFSTALAIARYGVKISIISLHGLYSRDTNRVAWMYSKQQLSTEQINLRMKLSFIYHASKRSNQ